MERPHILGTIMLQIVPDFTHIGDLAQLAKDLPDVKFNGPGWYLYPEKCMLLQAYKEDDDTRWHKKQRKNQVYIACVYSCPFYMTVFGSTTPPIREGLREGQQ